MSRSYDERMHRFRSMTHDEVRTWVNRTRRWAGGGGRAGHALGVAHALFEAFEAVHHTPTREERLAGEEE